jgi:hypothetical protein
MLFGRICDFCSKISFDEKGEDEDGKSSVARLSRKTMPCSMTSAQNWLGQYDSKEKGSEEMPLSSRPCVR